MLGAGIVKTLVAAAVEAVEVAREAVAHAGWYLRYQVNGTTREDDETPGRERSKAL